MSFVLHETVRAQELDSAAEQFMVPTRDGIALATDLYLPPSRARVPAVLVRTPYDKTSRYTRLPHMAKCLAAAGYAVVVQDVRGKFRSSGKTMPYASDVVDAYDTLDWVVGQSWSNGNVGLLGASYYGFTTWAGVASGHPAIRAAVCQVTGISMGDGHLASRWQREIPHLTGVDDLLQIWTDNDSHYFELDYSGTPWDAVEEAVAALGTRAPALDLLKHNIETGDTYTPYGSRTPYLTTKIPILHWVEWFDRGLATAGINDFLYFHNQPSSRHLHFLRAASGDHSGLRLSDLPLTDDTNPATNDVALQRHVERECDELIDFFDAFLMAGRTSPFRVRWEMGNGAWRNDQSWPPINPIHRLYPSAEHQLVTSPQPSSHDVAWTHDPDNPTPSGTTANEMWELLYYFPDDRELSNGPGALGFDTEPLSRDLDLAGTPIAALTVHVDGPSTHLFVRLIDVAQDGTARSISAGATVLYSASNDTQVRLPLQPTAYRFQAGHRLRLHVSSTDHPYAAIHPGTDENPWTAKRRVRRLHALRVGGNATSWIELPIGPGASDGAR